MEKQIFETMSKIRNRDSSIYDTNTHFFAEPTEDNKSDKAGKSSKKSKPSKPMLLKDVIAQQVQSCPASDRLRMTVAEYGQFSGDQIWQAFPEGLD